MTTVNINLAECIDILHEVIKITKNTFIKLALSVVKNYLVDLLYGEEEEEDVQFPEDTECHDG